MRHARSQNPLVWLFWLALGYGDEALTLLLGTRWEDFKRNVQILFRAYAALMGLGLITVALDWAMRPIFWITRRLRRSPLFRDYLTRVEDNRLFLLELDWRGPDATPVDDDFFKDTIRGRSLQPPRLPNHLVAEVNGQRVRLDRGLHGDPIRKEKRAGQDFPYSKVHSCTDPQLRATLEQADVKVVHLCREGAVCGGSDPCAMHFRKYTGVDAKALLDLDEDRKVGSPLVAALGALRAACWARVARLARHLLDVGCCCVRRRSRRRQPAPLQATNPRRTPPEEEDEWEPCVAEAVAWTDSKGKYCCSQLKGTCADRRAAAPTPLLVEDGFTSDSRGWARNAEGAPMACLCRYHSLEYKNTRHGLRCVEPGCWHLGEGGPSGKRRCAKHGR